jgi:2'-aminobiphenyl-2,3-diol 1,2-dioxygenase large subunit
MGKVEAVFCTSHVLMSKKDVEKQADRVVQGLKEIGRRVKELKPDLLVTISSDHMINLQLKLQPRVVVGIAESYIPFGDMGIPRKPLIGDREFGKSFAYLAADYGFDLCQAEELLLDHGTVLPLLFINPDFSIPITPILININTDPCITPSRAYALGKVLGKAIEDSNKRVVVIGEGGLSHWLNTSGQHGIINEKFDQWIIEKISSGQAAELAQLSIHDLLENAGNGGLEIMNWIMAAATLPKGRGVSLYYEPIQTWFTGMGAVALEAVS